MVQGIQTLCNNTDGRESDSIGSKVLDKDVEKGIAD